MKEEINEGRKEGRKEGRMEGRKEGEMKEGTCLFDNKTIYNKKNVIRLIMGILDVLTCLNRIDNYLVRFTGPTYGLSIIKRLPCLQPSDILLD